MADPHTDDLADRLDEMAVNGGDLFDLRLNMTYAERADLRAAAAELRALRQQVATLTDERDAARRQMQSLTEDFVAMEARAVTAESRLGTLTDAVGDALAQAESVSGECGELVACLCGPLATAFAAAVDALDQEDRA